MEAINFEYAERRMLYMEVESGFSEEENKSRFRKKWMKIGLEEQTLREMKKNGGWTMFEDFHSLWEELPDLKIRDKFQALLPGLDPEANLGRQIYK